MKYFFKQILNKLPGNGRNIIDAYHLIVLFLKTSLLKFRLFWGKYHIPDPYGVYWIEPERIKFHTNHGASKDIEDNVFHLKKDWAKIIGGDWDKSGSLFTDLKIYQAIKKRIDSNISWEKTDFYEHALKKINNNTPLWGCRGKNDFDQRLLFIDALIQKIHENGYTANSVPGNEITVNVGRNGQFLFQDGRHRLAIAKILKIEKIPVNIMVRHKLWQNFREEVFALAKGKSGASSVDGFLYQPCLHPDLSDVPAVHSCEDRFQPIKDNLTQFQGNVLDVGSNLCYFCHKLEDLGFDCFGIEINKELSKIAEKIRLAENKKFTIISDDILANLTSELNTRQYDIIIALNIFHHFLKTKHRFIQFKNWLNTIKTKVMFFEPHLFHEEQMNDAYKNFNEQEFVNFILNNTDLKNSKIIYRANDGRTVYKLSTE